MADWQQLAQLIATHGGPAGIILLVIGASVALGTAAGQYVTRGALVRVAEQMKRSGDTLHTVSVELTAQQRLHADFASTQRSHTEDLQRVAIELKSIADAIREADVRRSEQMMSLITTILTRRQQ